MTKRVAILQSNYIPWKGYFDLVGMVDVFVFLDDVQYTSNDWRNRNKIKTPHGLKWLSIPCGKSQDRKIFEVALSDHSWQKKHWELIQQNYQKAPYFEAYREMLEDFYQGHMWENLSQLNQFLIQKITLEVLGNTHTIFDDSRNYKTSARKGEKILEILEQVGASHYVSGPAAGDYLVEEEFMKRQIKLEWMDYSGYPEYDQFYPPFEHGVSILDLLFHQGPNAHNFLLSGKQ